MNSPTTNTVFLRGEEIRDEFGSLMAENSSRIVFYTYGICRAIYRPLTLDEQEKAHEALNPQVSVREIFKTIGITRQLIDKTKTGVRNGALVIRTGPRGAYKEHLGLFGVDHSEHHIDELEDYPAILDSLYNGLRLEEP